MWKLFLLAAITLTPLLSYAAGLVPCGGAGEATCGTCHMAQLINNVAGWIAMIMGIIVVILIMYRGLQMVVSVGNVSAKQSLKKNISTLLVGYAVILAGWMLVDTTIKFFLTDQVYGVWNEVRCISPTVPVKK